MAAHRHFLLAALIIVVGGGLRFAYLARDYTHPDEPIAAALVAHLHESRGFDTDWAHSALGTRYGRAQFNFSSYYLTLAAWDRLRWLAGREGGEANAPQTPAKNPGAPGGVAPPPLVWFRIFSALLGTLALVLAMRLAWEMRGWWLALGVGAWLAVNPQLVQDGHYARPEAFLTLWSLGLVLLCFPHRRWSWPRGVAAGALFGFLTACKVTMLLWCWAPFLVCLEFDPPESDQGAPGRRTRLAARMGIVIAAGIGGLVAGVPRVLGDPHGYWTSLEFLRKGYARGMGPFSHFEGGMVYDYFARYLLDTTGWWMAALFGLGLAAAVRHRQWRCGLAVFAPVLTAAAFVSTQPAFFERNLSHVMPLYGLGAGLGLATLAGWSRGALGRWNPVLVATVFAATLLLPATMTARLDNQGFSGRSEKIAADIQTKIANRFAGTTVYSSEGSPQDGLKILPWCWRDNGGPFLILWKCSNGPPGSYDFRPWSAAFDMVDLGCIPGLFDDLTTPSGLKVYFPCSTRVFLIKGPRQAPDRPDEAHPPAAPPRK